MAWSNGTFTRLYNWVTDRDAGIKIQATRMDGEDDGFATGINQCLNKDGSNAATGNLNLGGNRYTNAANGTSRTDLLTVAQNQDGGARYVAAAGTNTITATLTPAITAYANGQKFRLKAANTTTAAATLNINSVGALNLYYADGVTQIVAGAIVQNNIYDFEYNSSLNAAAGGFVVSNPSRVTGSFTVTVATGLTTTPSGTLNYSIGQDGKLVRVWAAAQIAGTSNATGMTLTGWPAAIQSTNATGTNAWWRDNSTNLLGLAAGLNGGTITCLGGAVASATGFTASGSKGIQAGFAITYSLD